MAAIDAANADDPHTIDIAGQSARQGAGPRRADDGLDRAAGRNADGGAAPGGSGPSPPSLDLAPGHLSRGSGGLPEVANGTRGPPSRGGAAILESCGYEPATIDRVQAIITKEGLGTDPEVAGP